MRRRAFVGGVFSGLAVGAQAAPTARATDLPKRRFGKTGVELTLIGQAGGRFELAGMEDAKAVVRRAYELGVNYFDNAPSYWRGNAEEVFGAVLPPWRKEVFITTKTTERKRAGAEKELEASLRRMKTDYVDLWQVHAVTTREDLDAIYGPGGAIEAFEAAKKAGKCRFIGVTAHFDPHILLEAIRRYEGYDTILMPLNVADPAYLSFEKIVLPEAVRQGLGIQGMKFAAVSKLLGSMSLGQCLGYVLSLPVHCVAVGCTSIGQIEDDVRAVRQFRPYTDQEMTELRKRGERLKGPVLENWKRKDEQARIAVPDYVGG